MLVVSYTHTLLAPGAEVNALVTVITLPAMLCTVRSSTVPAGSTAEMVPGVVKPVASSTVMAVVVALLMRPPRLAPAFTGSAMLITWPGRTMTPASMLVAKVTVSPE